MTVLVQSWMKPFTMPAGRAAASGGRDRTGGGAISASKNRWKRFHAWLETGLRPCPTQEGHASGSFPTGLPTVNHQSNKNQRGRPTVHMHRQSQLPRILRHMSSSAASSSRPGQPGAQYGRPFRSDPNRDEHRVPAALLDGPSPADLTSPPVGAFPCWMETVKRVHRCAGGVFAPTGLFRPYGGTAGAAALPTPGKIPRAGQGRAVCDWCGLPAARWTGGCAGVAGG